MLKIHNLHSKVEGNEILRGIDLVVNPGELHVLLGPNGSGKSTLGRVLVGDEAYEIMDGTVMFDGQDMLEMEVHERAQAGFFLSFQSPPAIDGVSANELLFAAKKSSAEEGDVVSGYKFKKKLKGLMDVLHLDQTFVDREIHKGASGGERRKMEMVSLFALEPRLAFLDEIDSGTDVDGLNAMAESLGAYLAEDNERSAIVVSHGQKLLGMLTPTHVHVMVRGKIVKTGGADLIDEIQRDGFKAFMPKLKMLSK